MQIETTKLTFRAKLYMQDLPHDEHTNVKQTNIATRRAALPRCEYPNPNIFGNSKSMPNP